MREVPPKETSAPNTPLKKIGIVATMINPTAPMKTMLFKIVFKYSVVGLPGRIPGTNPPCFLILFDTSKGLNVMEV